MRHKVILFTVFLIVAMGASVFAMKYVHRIQVRKKIAHKPTQDELIKKIVKNNLSQIIDCYNQRIRDGLNKTGNLKIAWDIDENGNPQNFEEVENQLNDAELYDCSSQAISEWRFPRGIYYKVNYTFHLKQKNQRVDLNRNVASSPDDAIPEDSQ